MKIFTIEFEHLYAYKLEDKDPMSKEVTDLMGKLAQRKELFERIGVKKGFSPSIYGSIEQFPLLAYGQAKFACGETMLIEIMASGEKVSVLDVTEQGSTDYAAHAERFEAILRKMEKQLERSFPENSYNGRCDVHVPGNALSIYNETLLLEDSCSDVLQNALSEGWRIVAVCPQPDQRRPDYILGRFNQDFENISSKSRRIA